MSNGAGTDSVNNNSICISTVGATVMIWEKFYVEIQGDQVTAVAPSWGRPWTGGRIARRTNRSNVFSRKPFRFNGVNIKRIHAALKLPTPSV